MTIPATPANRDRLAALRTATRDARKRRKDARDAVDMAVKTGNTAAQEIAAQAFQEAQDSLELNQQLEVTLLGQLSGGIGGTAFGQSFLEDPQALASLERMSTSSMPVGKVELGPYLNREQAIELTGQSLAVAGQVTPSAGMTRGPFGPIIPSLTPPTAFLDLVPTVALDVPSMPYAQEVGAASAAATVAPGATKPAAAIDYVDAEAKPVVIAEFVKVNKPTLPDIPQLQTQIQNRLITGVLQALEQQVIAGDGTGTNMLGILNTAGLGSIPYTAGEQTADEILDGITAILISGARPNVVALNPLDWSTLLKTKASGSGEYTASPFLSTAQSVWGVNLVPATGIPAGVALIGDTRIGLQLLVREGVHVVVSDADTDDFTRNRVTLLAEGRWASAVFVPAAFCAVHLTA
jgi:Phage capsid family